MALSIVAYLAWVIVIVPALRIITTVLAIGLAVAITGTLLALALAITPENHWPWVLGSIFVVALASVAVMKRPGGPERKALTVQGTEKPELRRGHPTASVERPPADESQTDVKVNLRWSDRLRLTKTARARRRAAKVAGEVADAWLELAREAPFAQNRLSAARRSSERFAAVAATRPFDTEALAHLIVLQKRVPEMIRRRLALCSDATPGQRFRLLEDLIDQLERIAAEGERRLALHDFISFDALETERTYLDTYLSQGGNQVPRTSAT